MDLATRILESGKHVYVEKPLALTLTGAQKIAVTSKKNSRRVMVGHLIRYHAAFIELQAQVRAGAIGTLRHIQANRLAMGRIRKTESVLFDLCPHDLSLIQALTGSEPTKVSSAGASHDTPGIVDTTATMLGFAGGVSASLQTCWISPYKEHRLTVSGTADHSFLTTPKRGRKSWCCFRITSAPTMRASLSSALVLLRFRLPRANR